MPLFNNDATDATFCVASFFLPFGRLALSATEAALWQINGYTDAQQAAIENDLGRFMASMSGVQTVGTMGAYGGIRYGDVEFGEYIPEGLLVDAFTYNQRNKSRLVIAPLRPYIMAYWCDTPINVDYFNSQGVEVFTTAQMNVLEVQTLVTFHIDTLPYLETPIRLLFMP